MQDINLSTISDEMLMAELTARGKLPKKHMFVYGENMTVSDSFTSLHKWWYTTDTDDDLPEDVKKIINMISISFTGNLDKSNVHLRDIAFHEENELCISGHTGEGDDWVDNWFINIDTRMYGHIPATMKNINNVINECVIVTLDGMIITLQDDIKHYQEAIRKYSHIIDKRVSRRDTLKVIMDACDG